MIWPWVIWLYEHSGEYSIANRLLHIAQSKISDLFERLSTTTSNLKHLKNPSSIQHHCCPSGGVYDLLDQKIIMQFVHVELKVYIPWMEKGDEKSKSQGTPNYNQSQRCQSRDTQLVCFE